MFSFRLSLVINRFFAGLSFATLLSAGAHAGLKCRSDLDGNGVVNRADLQFTLDRWGTGKSSADLNGDGVTDGADLGIVLSEWGALCGLSSCPADFNGDRYVDQADINHLINNWTAQDSQQTQSSSADLNKDGVIDGMDLGIALAAFGPCDVNNCSQRSVLSDPKLAAKIFGGLKIPGTETGLSLPGPRDPRTLKESSK